MAEASPAELSLCYCSGGSQIPSDPLTQPLDDGCEDVVSVEAALRILLHVDWVFVRHLRYYWDPRMRWKRRYSPTTLLLQAVGDTPSLRY